MYIGKEQHPLSILNMSHITRKVWRRNSSFGSFASTIRGKATVHDTAGLISFVLSDINFRITAIFIESLIAKDLIICSITLESLSYL